MDSNEKLLNAMYKNCVMAVESLKIIMNEVKDNDFLQDIMRRKREYEDILNCCVIKASQKSLSLKQHSFSKAQLWVSLKMNTIADKSVRKYACLIYFGTSMGIPDLLIALTDFDDADEEIIFLAKRLKEVDEKNEQDIKKYLCSAEYK